MVEGIEEKIAFIFPGQGAQYPGMGKDLYDNFKGAKGIFDKADEILGYSLSDICFEGPADKLASTEISQPAILTTSIAALEALKEVGIMVSANFFAGLSLGEYSALTSASSMSFEEAVALVSKRGKLMREASIKNPGKMISIIGLSPAQAKEVAQLTKTYVANLNCPGQVVISGREDDIEEAKTKAIEVGAKKVILLKVSGPFHSELMTSASESLKEELEKVNIAPPKGKVIFNVTARDENEPALIKENLFRQVNHTTFWQKSVENIAGRECRIFFEIGPGQILRGLLKRINPELKVSNAANLEDIRRIEKEFAK